MEVGGCGGGGAGGAGVFAIMGTCSGQKKMGGLGVQDRIWTTSFSSLYLIINSPRDE